MIEGTSAFQMTFSVPVVALICDYGLALNALHREAGGHGIRIIQPGEPLPPDPRVIDSRLFNWEAGVLSAPPSAPA